MHFGNRQFQFWQYRVSHGELLIRSPKDHEFDRNVDIMFVGVEYVDLPRFLPGLTIQERVESDLEKARERLGERLASNTVYVITSGLKRYLVVAASMIARESDLDLFESPFGADYGFSGS